MTTHYTRGSVSTLHGVGGVLGTAFGHYFFFGGGDGGLSQFHGHDSWFVCEFGPKGEFPCRQLAH